MPDPQKTLVILSPAFPANESETSWVAPKQLFVRKLAENFPELRIIVLAFSHPQHTDPYTWKGIEVIPFNGMHAAGFKRLKLWRRIWKYLLKIKREQNIIGIYSFWCGQCALVGKWFAKRHGIRHFIWISGMDARKENNLVKYIRPKPDELVAMSLFLVDEFQKNHGITPKHVIPIGIEPSEFSAAPEIRDIDVMGAGSLNPFKQYDIFIQVVKELSKTRTNIKAVLCGDGAEKARLQTLIRENGLESNIELKGLTPKKEVLQYMQRSRIFIHPSSYEGFGAVFLEALYAGAELISFCNPMKLNEPHWHIVQSGEEMALQAKRLLSSSIGHEPVMLYSMDETAKSVMNLFTGNSAMTGNISYYDAIAHVYDETMDADRSNEAVRARVKEKLQGLLSSGWVLDFGGGTGSDLQWLTGAGYQVLFCEPSDAMRQKAIQLNETSLQGQQIVFLDKSCTDFTRWGHQPPAGIKADAMIANFGVINYIPDLPALFQNLAVALKPGAEVILVVLRFSLRQRLRWHRRNALKSLLFRVPFVMYISYHEQRQTVFVHTEKAIRMASAPWFSFQSSEPVTGFTLIHLTRQ
jgi:glycosyltransferase involved in cell wall biosynthesis/SAM-dependent methyltransferase